ncbi:carboxylesterase family protein, partial [bacterium]|nr:carboxylesterase family protein [bacterium]
MAKLNADAWRYNEADDIYYQLGVPYCAKPADRELATLAVFVPGAYLEASPNGDGTYTGKINESARIGPYTARTAPVVMPVITPGYMAQSPLADYSAEVNDYVKQGFVYVHAGCRGRESGAPAGVTDLKAAVRFVRYSAENMAGDPESIFTFGMSGGGAQSALLGAAGDSALYQPYLQEIGAVPHVSDAVLGSMCWCPITNLDSADSAYEWMMGATRKFTSAEDKVLSERLARAFADYINHAQFKDDDSFVMYLEESPDGLYQAGTYYEYIKAEIEKSLNDFLTNTSFPYTVPDNALMRKPEAGELPASLGMAPAKGEKSFE